MTVSRAQIKRRLENDSFKDVKGICENMLYINIAITNEIVTSNCFPKVGVNNTTTASNETIAYRKTWLFSNFSLAIIVRITPILLII